MISLIIILFSVVWGIAGVIWGISNDVGQDDIKDYTISTIIIGGPLWWFILLLEVLINFFILFARLIKISKIKPKKRLTK